MKVNRINYNTPNFQARIVIKKQGVENLLKDVAGSSKIGVRSSASTSSGVAEATSFPSDIIYEGNGLSAVMRSNVKAIEKESDAISARDLRTVESGNKMASNELGESAKAASTGSSLLGSASGSYYSSGASALDQSAHYPNSSYTMDSYEAIKNLGGERSAEYVYDTQDWAYQLLYREHAAGNESASSASTTASGLGLFSHIAGSGGISESAKLFNKSKKNIPS